jgi:hypothetical protein
VTGFRAGVDQIDHRLGLRQIETPIEKGTLGKLAGLGHAGTAGQHGLQHAPGTDRTAVAANLCHVLAGVRARATHHTEQGFIHPLPLGIDDITVISPVRCRVAQRLSRRPHKDLPDERQSASPTDANDTNTAHPRRGRDGRNGIALVHASPPPLTGRLGLFRFLIAGAVD